MNEEWVVSKKEKVAYGMGDLAINIAYGAIGFYFVFFLTDVAGLPVDWAGLIFLIARVWDAITDYAMGVISDRTKSRFGRRRPYILFGSIPFGIMFFMLWITPFESDLLLFFYYTTVTILFNTAFTVVAIPYNAMLPELSQNYDERTSIAGFKMGLSFVGTLLAAAGSAIIIDVIFPGKDVYRSSFPVMGAIFGGLIAASLLVTFTGTKERVTSFDSLSTGHFFENLRSILKLSEFRIVLGMFLFNMIGFDLIQVVLIYFLKHVIHVSEDLSFVFMAIPLVVAIASVPMWIAIGKKWGKKNAYIFAAIYLSLSFLLCLFVPEGGMNWMIVLCVLAGVGISASQVIPFSIIPDVIEIDEHKNGVRREGAIYGVIMFLYKAASAIAINLFAVLLAFFGYLETRAGQTEIDTVQPDSAILAIRIIMGVGPGICFLLSAVFVKMLPITKESFAEVKEALEQRRGGGRR